MKKVFVFIIISMFFVGYANGQNSVSAENLKMFRPASENFQLPELNVETEVEIGQTIVSKARQIVHPAISIESDISFKVDPSFFANSWAGTANIRKGLFKQYVANSEGDFYLDPNATFTFFAGDLKQQGGIFVPFDEAKPIVPWTFHKKTFYFGSVPVEIVKTNVRTWEKDSFTKELIYGGVSQNTIAISYREFSDNTARPAFTQDLKYDLSQGDTIGFRGARFQIIKATNITLRYKVIKLLD